MKKEACRWKCCPWILLSLLLLAGGCSGEDGRQNLFEDDFSNAQGVWGTDRRGEFRRGYERGEYFFEMDEPSWFAWARAGRSFEDVSVEVDATLGSGSPDGHFGVLCRYVDDDDFYYFAVSADGYYAIFLKDGDELIPLTGDGSGMLPSSVILTDEEEVNHIRGVCRGERLSLYVNDELVATVADESLERGDVGIGAGSGPTGDGLITFDDFVVSEP